LQAGTVAARAGSGGLFLLEADAITVGNVQASVQRVQADGSTDTADTTIVDGVISDLRTSAGGAIALATTAGSITLAEGSSPGTAGAISASGGGAITLSAGGATSDVLLGANLASDGGSISVQAGDSVLFSNDADVLSSGTASISVTASAGDVLMDAGSVLASGSGPIAILAGGDILPGSLQTSGQATMDSTGGAVLIVRPVDRNGDDVTIRSNEVTITAPLSSAGATLTITPLTNVPVVIGGSDPATPALHLGTDELAMIQDGFGEIVIGGSLAGQLVQVRGTAAPIVFHDPVVLTASGAGGSVQIDGVLQGDTLRILDTGTSTVLTGASITLQGGLTIQDSVVLDGANTLAVGTSGRGGDIVVQQALSGNGGSTDTLVLDANGGNVQLAAITNLDGLDIADAVNVSFTGPVSLDGDLVIHATGTVTFAGPLTLHAGARLVIVGGGQVAFQAAADVGSGDVTIEATSVVATGGAGSITGSGTLALRSSTAGLVIGDGAAPATALHLVSQTLQAIGGGFQEVRLGTAGSGQVSFSGSAGFSAAGMVTLDPGAGELTDARRDAAADVFAQAVTVRGNGPLQGGSGDVVEVAASMIYVDAGDGIALRESGTDGRVYYSVLNGSSVHQQVVSVGPSVRVTTDPKDVMTGGHYADLLAALAGTGGLRANAPISAMLAPAPAPAALNTGVQAYLSSAIGGAAAPITLQLAGVEEDADGMMSSQSYGLAARLEQAWVLGSPGSQPLANGASSTDPVFDYWVESLEL
jgi:hypothetical protein